MPRHPDTSEAPLVAFDFDGTLTCRDSFAAFLAWRAGPIGFAAGLAALVPAMAAYTRDRDRGALKAALVGRFLGGLTRGELTDLARRFHAARGESLMRPDALACWRDWRARGARLYIVTASPEMLVAPFAEALGADGLIGTRLAFDAEGRLAGALEGANCRGPEKVARLRQALGETARLAAAYGDSDGDHAMLALADAPGLNVFKARAERSLGRSA
jgi:phosphatidylglycerophosphatase C